MLGKTLNGWTIKPYVGRNGSEQEYIGKGGMSTLYYAENRLNRKAAIKILNAKYYLEPSVRQRFLQEAYSLVRVNHINIVDVYDLVEINENDNRDSSIAMIMEYLEGLDLKQYLELRGAVDEHTMTEWLHQILPALSYIHEQRIFHRDIKPSNLFLTTEGRIKIIDFGIIKIAEPEMVMTQTEQMLGTPIYMSPEQILTPRDIDQRSDIYALGITIIALMTGRQPYNASSDSTPFAIQKKIVEEQVYLPNGLSPAFYRALSKAVEKRRENRFNNCNEFLATLNAGGHTPVLSCPNPVCDAMISVNSVFCLKCGTPRESVFCPGGHLITNPSARFCKTCGAKIVR